MSPGKPTQYPAHYDPSLLCPLPRSDGRDVLKLTAELPFTGVDLWTAYEISWLDNLGKPQVAIGEFTIPCDSPFLIESKSLKLYLNSLNQHRLADRVVLAGIIARDLSRACGGDANIVLYSLREFQQRGVGSFNGGVSLDAMEVECIDYQPNPELLCISESVSQTEILYSDLLKSNCPATGQPDWASVQINYTGPAINHAGLLRYIVSLRNHAGFHEHCVERIFMDIHRRCRPERLSVYARYTRRGGIDINPLRTTDEFVQALGTRQVRQ